MRNGNTSMHWVIRLQVIRSYPTYEEWKRFIFEEPKPKPGYRSYPTYEEWKQRLYQLRPACRRG